MAISQGTVLDNNPLAWSTVNPSNGDMFILFFYNDGGDDQGTGPGTITRFDTDVGTSMEAGAYYYTCTGSETGNVFTTENDFNNMGNEGYNAHWFLVPAAEWHGTTAPEYAKANASNGTVDPPNLTPSGWDASAEDTIWIICGGRDDDDGISAVSSGYSTNEQLTENVNQVEVGSSYRIAATASENPGTYTHTGTAEEWVAYTIAIRPEVAVTKYYQSAAGVASFVGNIPSFKAGKQTAGEVSFIGNIPNFKAGKQVAGEVGFLGAVSKKAYEALAGGLSFIGAISKKAYEALAGSLSFVGTSIEKGLKKLAGDIGFVGDLIADKLAEFYQQALDGTLTSSGDITLFKTKKQLAGDLGFIGAISKKVYEALTGGLSFIGDIPSFKAGKQLVNNAVSFVGNIPSFKASKMLAGGVGFVGDVVGKALKKLAGGVSFSGFLDPVKQAGGLFFQSVSGALSFVGDIPSFKAGKQLAGGLGFVGTVSKKWSEALAGGISFVGTVSKKWFEALAGGISFIGTSAEKAYKKLAGGISFVGTSIEKGFKKLAGEVSFAGNLIKKTILDFAGSADFSGYLDATKLVGIFYKSLAGVLTTSGTISKKWTESLAGSLSFVGTSVEKALKKLVGEVSFVGTPKKKTQTAFAGSLSFVGSSIRKALKKLAGALSYIGTLIATELGLVYAFLDGAVSFAGAITKIFVKTTNEGSIGFEGRVYVQLVGDNFASEWKSAAWGWSGSSGGSSS
jgi:hypothetical protein